MVKKEKKLSDKEWNDLVRGFLSDIVKKHTLERGASSKAAKALNMSPTSIRDLKNGAKGTVVTWFRFFVHMLGWSDKEVKEKLEDSETFIQKIKKVGPPDIIEGLVSEILKIYPRDEVIAWLKLLLSKAKVEQSLDLDITAKPKKRKKK